MKTLSQTAAKMIDAKKIHLNVTIQHFLLKFICWYILVIFMFFIRNEIDGGGIAVE